MDNEFVDEIVQRGGGWDVEKRHTVKLRDQVDQYFPPLWMRDVPKGDDEEVTCIFGTDLAQTTPESTINQYQNGRYVTIHLNGSDAFRQLVDIGQPFSFQQRFVFIQPENELTGTLGFSLACRAHASYNGKQVSPPRSFSYYTSQSYEYREWDMSIGAIKVLSVKNRSQELAAQERIRSFLMLLKMGV